MEDIKEIIDLSQSDDDIKVVPNVPEVIGGNTMPRSSSSDMKGSYRHWCFTDWKCEVKYDSTWMNYLIIGEEIAPTTNNKHFQCHVYSSKKIRFSQIKKLLPIGCHIERSIDPDASIKYCMKEGKYQEFGHKPEQGKRNDLIAIKDSIMNGKKVNELVLEDPMCYHQYGRTLNKIEDIKNSQMKRDFVPYVEWIYGPTGTGKSHYVYSKEGDLYSKSFNDDKWWDGYNYQEAVLLDDYRGEMKYNELLKLLDKYPYTVPRRGRAPIQMMAKRFYITAPSKPEEIYMNQGSDDIGQLLRRITKVTEMKDRYIPPNDNEDESL